MAAKENLGTLGKENCIFHPQNKLLFECKDCRGELACIACVTSTHKKHELMDMNLTKLEKVEKSKSPCQNTANRSLPEIVNDIQITIESLQEKEREYKEEILTVKMHSKSLKKQVDIFTADKISKLEALLEQTTDMLSMHKTDLEKLQQKFENDTHEYKHSVKSLTDALEINAAVQLVQTEETLNLQKISSNTSLRKDPKQHMAKNEKGVGEGRGKNSRDSEKLQQTDMQQFKFLDQPKTLYNVNTSYYATCNSISATLDNMAWMYGLDDRLHLIDETGEEKETLKPNVRLRNICMHPSTGKLYCTTVLDNTIRRVDVKNGKISVLFTAESGPYGIGCTTDNHVVIVHHKDSKLCLYDFEGRAIFTYTYASAIPEVTVCNKTNNVALMQGSDGVMVLNSKLQKLYQFKRPGAGRREKFTTHTAVFVDKYLLVGDYLLEDILVVQDGKLVHTIHTKEMSKVMAICVQKDPRVLHVCCFNPNKILCIKYIE